MSSATDVGLTSYEAGSGVVDIDQAIDAPVIASGSGDFGTLAWGEAPDAVVRSVDYTNRSADDVVLRAVGGARRRADDVLAIDADDARDPGRRDAHGHDDRRPRRGAGRHPVLGHPRRVDRRHRRRTHRARHHRRARALRPHGHGDRLRRRARRHLRHPVPGRDGHLRADRRRRRGHDAPARRAVLGDVVHGRRPRGRREGDRAGRRPRPRARRPRRGRLRRTCHEAGHRRRRRGRPRSRLQQDVVPRRRVHGQHLRPAVDRRLLRPADGGAERRGLRVHDPLASAAADARADRGQGAARPHHAGRFDLPRRRRSRPRPSTPAPAAPRSSPRSVRRSPARSRSSPGRTTSRRTSAPSTRSPRARRCSSW